MKIGNYSYYCLRGIGVPAMRLYDEKVEYHAAAGKLN